MLKKITALLALLILPSLACTITVPTVRTVDTGATQTLTLAEALPEGAAPARLLIEMGAGSLTLAPGAKNFVDGEIRCNVDTWQPKVTRQDGRLSLLQPTSLTAQFPNNDIVNEWDLRLGSAAPFELEVNAGAYDGSLDLSGLPITRLEMSSGASSVSVSFSQPNPQSMRMLSFKTGASSVNLSGLANANFQEMTFEGGAGSYQLDFGGDLLQPANVRITGGVSSTTLRIPAETNAEVIVSGGLNNISPSGTWTISGSTYRAEGPGPLLTIRVELGVGSLELIRADAD